MYSAFKKWTSLQFYSFKMKIKKFRQKMIKFILLTTQRHRCQGKTPRNDIRKNLKIWLDERYHLVRCRFLQCTALDGSPPMTMYHCITFFLISTQVSLHLVTVIWYANIFHLIHTPHTSSCYLSESKDSYLTEPQSDIHIANGTKVYL